MLNLIVAPKIHNPVAEKHTKKIVKFLKSKNVEYSVYFLRDFADMSGYVKELISFGETEFVVVGDDVVVNEFLNLNKDLSKIKLGIVPTNKKDDFSSYLNLSYKPVQAIKDILEKQISAIDLLLVNNVKVLNNVCIGASAEVFEKYSQFKFKSLATKQFAMLKYGNNFNGIELNIGTKNNKGKSINIFDMVVANGGNSKHREVSPYSNVNDGLFNVTYCIAGAKAENKKHLKLFNKGKHVYVDSVKQRWVNNIKITADKPIKAMVDGKFMEFDSLDISIVENGLKLYKK